jgi:hypothetical protein
VRRCCRHHHNPTLAMQPAGQDPEARLVPGTVTLPLRSRTNASPFWIMLLLVGGRSEHGMTRRRSRHLRGRRDSRALNRVSGDDKLNWWSISGGGTHRSRGWSKSGSFCDHFVARFLALVFGPLAVFYRRRHSSLHAIESHSATGGGPILGGRRSRASSHSRTSDIRTTVRCGREHRR